MSDNFTEGFDLLFSELESYIDKASDGKIIDILELGAKEFVNDLKKIPKPRSQINKAGYTHLVQSFSYRRKSKEVEIGWGVYWGRMVEGGTSKTRAQPHMIPLWNRNKEKYYKTMINRIQK